MSRPGMADGRMFTSYSTNCQMNDLIQTNKGFTNNVEYKNYIQNNAINVMDMFTSHIKETSIVTNQTN